MRLEITREEAQVLESMLDKVEETADNLAGAMNGPGKEVFLHRARVLGDLHRRIQRFLRVPEQG